ncbi:MAG: ankyrin repeat domain-containing protein [Tatlockia sp.]|nr:ankyrin repeat domain-containing protein [Tatlockia sp.]
MLVNRIQLFISYLIPFTAQLNQYDLDLLFNLQTKYESSNENESLTWQELTWLKNALMARWAEVAVTVDDYTFNISDLCILWINLAKDLAAELDIDYLIILKPPLNCPDKLKDLTKLDTNFKGHHLYLGKDNITPRSTSEFFVTSDYLNLVELFRIKAKSTNEFRLEDKENNQSFLNFWDYLIKEKFHTFQISGRLSLNLLEDLLRFLESYRDMLNSKAFPSSHIFYKMLKEFSVKLDKYPADDVNYFYSINIPIYNQNFLLIEIFLDCLLFSQHLEVKLDALMSWLQEIVHLIKNLFLAVGKSDLKKVLDLLFKGLNVNVIDNHEQGLLHIVSDIVIADYLIKKVAKLNTKDICGNTPLHSSVKRNNVVLTKRLLEESSIQFSKNELGNTPLHIAAHQQFEEGDVFLFHSQLDGKRERFANLEIVSSLLKRGANPNCRNYFGYTAIHLAVSCNHNCLGEKNTVIKPDYNHLKRKVVILCNNGANLQIKTNTNRLINTHGTYHNKNFNIYENLTALEIMYFHGSNSDGKNQFKIKKEIAKILTAKGINSKERLAVLNSCVKFGDFEGLKLFINYGVDKKAPFRQGDLSLLLLKLFNWQSEKTNWEKKGRLCAELLYLAGADPCLVLQWVNKMNAQINPFSEICDEAIEYLQSYEIEDQGLKLSRSLG